MNTIRLSRFAPASMKTRIARAQTRPGERPAWPRRTVSALHGDVQAHRLQAHLCVDAQTCARRAPPSHMSPCRKSPGMGRGCGVSFHRRPARGSPAITLWGSGLQLGRAGFSWDAAAGPAAGIFWERGPWPPVCTCLRHWAAGWPP